MRNDSQLELFVLSLLRSKIAHACVLDLNDYSLTKLQGEIHHVMNPDPYRGTFGSDGAAYAKEVEEHITYGSSGRVAGFIAETFQV